MINMRMMRAMRVVIMMRMRRIIQLPFVLESVIAALLGASLAIGAIVGVKIVLVDGFLEPSFQFTPFVGWEAVWQVAAVLVAIGVLLAALSALLTLRRYLRV